jgi:hypothetical protein
MPTTAQFWEYAKEATLSAYEAKTDEDKDALLGLAHTWALAAMIERHALVQYNSERDVLVSVEPRTQRSKKRK